MNPLPRHNSVNRPLTEKDVGGILMRYGVNASVLDARVYQNAMVHRSYRGHDVAPESRPENCMPLQPADYERLEHLGDAVVGLAVTDYLHERYPGESEGFITQLRMQIVSGVILSKMSFAVGLNRWVLLSAQAEADRARERPCVAEDVFEAFVAAVFKCCGYDTARAWVVGVLHEHLDIAALIFSLRCTKDRLIRSCSDRFGFRPSIHTARADGQFVCTVQDAAGAALASACGPSPREAELSACQSAWEALLRRAN